jgi:hypothetical protein
VWGHAPEIFFSDRRTRSGVCAKPVCELLRQDTLHPLLGFTQPPAIPPWGALTHAQTWPPENYGCARNFMASARVRWWRPRSAKLLVEDSAWLPTVS